jgi:glycosyltransferase involved in cell wall biosynthesis
MDLDVKKIAVLVSNDLQGDSRIEKIAETLTSAGANVVVFALGSSRFPVYATRNGFGIFRPACAITGNSTQGDKREAKRVPFKLQIYRWIKYGTRPFFLGGGIHIGWESDSKVMSTSKPEGDAEYEWRIAALEHAWRKRLLIWAPDVIHANDADTLGIAVRIAEELRKSGRTCAIVFDQHEYIPGMNMDDSQWKRFMLNEEATFINKVNAITTVSDFMLTDLINRYHIDVPSEVILNAPSIHREETNPKLTTIRATLDLGVSVPLHVYVGILAPKRGLHTAVDALAYLENHHVAIVTRSRGKYFEELVLKAQELGVSDRLHWLPYVPANYVSTFIGDATSGLVAHVSVPAHEVSLGTKVFEYVFAGLPIISSDGLFRSQVIREFNLGEIYAPEDDQELANAMRVVANREAGYYNRQHKQLVEEWCWENQGSKLLELYRSIM